MAKDVELEYKGMALKRHRPSPLSQSVWLVEPTAPYSDPCSIESLMEFCREVLWKSIVEKSCKEVLEKSCREFLEKNVKPMFCRESLKKKRNVGGESYKNLLERKSIEKSYREALEKSLGEGCCRRVFEKSIAKKS